MNKNLFLLNILFVTYSFADNSPTIQGCNLAETPLGSLIGQLESKNDYNIANKLHPYEILHNIPLTTMTLGEVQAMQFSNGYAGNGSETTNILHATGRFQIIGQTLHSCKTSLNLGNDVLYNKNTQDYIFTNCLVYGAAKKFLYGKSENANDALYLISKQWASMPVPKGYKTKSGRISDGTNAYYDNDGVNATHSKTTADNAENILKETQKQVADGNCHPVDINVTSPQNPQNPPTPSQNEVKVKKYDYDGTCKDYIFTPEQNNCGFAPAQSKSIQTATPYTYATKNVDDCYCANDYGGKWGLVNSMIRPSEIKLNEEISQMIIDSRNTLVYLREYWTRGIAVDTLQTTSQTGYQPKFNTLQRELSQELKKKNDKKCFDLDIQISNLNTQIIELENQILYFATSYKGN